MTNEKIEHELEEINKELGSLNAKYNSLFSVISGNDPIVGKTKSFAERLANVEKTQTYLKVLLIGIAIGIIVGGLIFGVLTLKQVTEAIKTVSK